MGAGVKKGADLREIPVSALEHYSYCPRQCGLIHVEAVFEENALTLHGASLHRRVDCPNVRHEGGVRVERAVPVWSEELGLIGRTDAVEFHADGTVRPVEYKRGGRKPMRHEAIQVCAQALCLEEMLGVSIEFGAVFYWAKRNLVPVRLDGELRAEVVRAVYAVREMLEVGVTPPPYNDRRCDKCSLAEVCLPEATLRIREHDGPGLFIIGTDELAMGEEDF